MKKKELLFILIVTFSVILMWVIADIIHTRPNQPLNPQLESALQPIIPTFDDQTLDRINKIKTIPSNPFTPPAPTLTPTPRPTPLPSIAPPPILSPTASSSATPSASLNQVP